MCIRDRSSSCSSNQSAFPKILIQPMLTASLVNLAFSKQRVEMICSDKIEIKLFVAENLSS